MSPKIWLIIASVIGAVLIIVGAVLGFKVLPDYVDEEIKKSVYLEEGSEQYERWEKLPFPLTFKIYVFDVLNPDKILTGDKPQVHEKGPYIYKQSRKKEDITYYEDDDIYNYRQIQNYEFDEVTSAPLTLEDEVVVLNSPKYGVFEALIDKHLTAMGNLGANGAFPDTTDTIFHKIKVKDYFFGGYKFCKKEGLVGFSKILCSNVKGIAKTMKTMEIFDDYIQFSFFRFKDNKDDGVYNISAGISDVMQTGQITSFNGDDHLDIWGEHDSTCNAVKGTDSSIFGPFNEKDTVINVFSSDICRSVSLVYQKDVEYKDITGYRSVMKSNTFASPEDFEENECFCINETRTLENEKTCFPSGFLDMKGCLESPVLVSLPHFLGADKSYQEMVEGLDPHPEMHSTFVDLEPNTGTPLRGAKRIQFNMVLRPNSELTVLKTVPKAIMPILWIEEGVELPENLVQKLKDDYFSKLPMIEGLKWGLISVGIATIVICLFLYLCKFRK